MNRLSLALFLAVLLLSEVHSVKRGRGRGKKKKKTEPPTTTPPTTTPPTTTHWITSTETWPTSSWYTSTDQGPTYISSTSGVRIETRVSRSNFQTTDKEVTLPEITVTSTSEGIATRDGQSPDTSTTNPPENMTSITGPWTTTPLEIQTSPTSTSYQTGERQEKQTTATTASPTSYSPTTDDNPDTDENNTGSFSGTYMDTTPTTLPTTSSSNYIWTTDEGDGNADTTPPTSSMFWTTTWWTSSWPWTTGPTNDGDTTWFSTTWWPTTTLQTTTPPTTSERKTTLFKSTRQHTTLPFNYCADHTYACKKRRKCIGKGRLCDGRRDCPGGDDEEGCSNETGGDQDAMIYMPECKADEFHCKHHGKDVCLPNKRKCDGMLDCDDKTDEEGCQVLKCYTGTWPCNDGLRCVAQTEWCNGVRNCKDNSDESNCPDDNCGKDEWRCKTGDCILDHFKCDGYWDCWDGSDESEKLCLDF